MKKVHLVALLIAGALIAYTIWTFQKTKTLFEGHDIKILIVYDARCSGNCSSILNAYQSVLQEEGVPFKIADAYQIMENQPEHVAKRIPALIFPDSIVQNLPAGFNPWLRKYLAVGGNLLIVYDAGVKSKRDRYLDNSTLSDILGFNTITFQTAGADAYTHGQIMFATNEARDFFQIPSGKTMPQRIQNKNGDHPTLSGYGYGRLTYPVSRIESIKNAASSPTIYAYGVTEKDTIPAIVLTDYAQGKVLYVNLPLGHLKANSDDLPLRSVLRTFLFSIVEIPHLMNVERGLGSIVINWHVDFELEHKTLPDMKKMGLLRKTIPASFHITAGEFCDKPGDGEGFDACGKGRPFFDLIRPYGSIGSHGGWAHNWFAKNIEDGVFKEKEMRHYIVKNNTCLEKLSGHPIIEYSAPNGVHPQPTLTAILEDLGFIAYYSTGDTGAAPNRAFFEGKMISRKVIAFPVIPFGKVASLYEMDVLDKRKESEVIAWFYDVLAYVANNRTVRLVYSHPYNIEHYPRAVKAFLDRIESLQQDKKISVSTMTDYASFLLRFLKTQYSFKQENGKLYVHLKNPEGLAGICIALPKKKYQKPALPDITIQEDNGFYYATVERNDKEKHFTLDAH
ncbi:MAG: hypothetical protein WC539_04040 [Nitrospirota bacterium]